MSILGEFMKPTPVQRYLFSKEEVIAALFDVTIPCEFKDVRIDGDEVVVEFVNPRVVDQPQPQGGDQDQAEQPPERPIAPEQSRSRAGENEYEAISLCETQGFRTFLEVKTAEAAQRILLERCHAKIFSEFDTVKTWKANFRDVVAEYEVWLRGD